MSRSASMGRGAASPSCTQKTNKRITFFSTHFPYRGLNTTLQSINQNKKSKPRGPHRQLVRKTLEQPKLWKKGETTRWEATKTWTLPVVGSRGRRRGTVRGVGLGWRWCGGGDGEGSKRGRRRPWPWRWRGAPTRQNLSLSANSIYTYNRSEGADKVSFGSCRINDWSGPPNLVGSFRLERLNKMI